MNYRVFIDMKNENALYTVSMLSAMLEDGTGNYLDLLTPFVLYSLPKTIDSPISIDAVTEAMREFGFKDFPYKTSEKILNRLCKVSGDDPVYVRATSANKKRKYWVSAVYNASDFTTRRTEMRRKIDGILKAMQEYIVIYTRISCNMNKGIILRVFGNVKMLLICPNEYIDGTIILALMSDKDTTNKK